jgi:hypothetical protein
MKINHKVTLTFIQFYSLEPNLGAIVDFGLRIAACDELSRVD